MGSEIHYLSMSFLAVSLGAIGSISFAQEPRHVTWTEELARASDCVAQSEPDFERAVSCYEGAIGYCVGKKIYRQCLKDSAGELRRLLPLYNSHKHATEIALQYDPSRCVEFQELEHDLPEEEFLLQCQFTALLTQVIAGHVASVWGELHFQD